MRWGSQGVDFGFEGTCLPSWLYRNRHAFRSRLERLSLPADSSSTKADANATKKEAAATHAAANAVAHKGIPRAPLVSVNVAAQLSNTTNTAKFDQ